MLHSWLQNQPRSETQKIILQYVHEQSLFDFGYVTGDYSKMLKKHPYLHVFADLFGDSMPSQAFALFSKMNKQYKDIAQEKIDGNNSKPARKCSHMWLPYIGRHGIHDSLSILKKFQILSDCELIKDGNNFISKNDTLGYNEKLIFHHDFHYLECWNGLNNHSSNEFIAVIMAYYRFCLPLWK